jgi:hypothetical protein
MSETRKKVPKELYERTAQTSAKAAMNENLAPGLRAYYAALALHYDKKASRS